mmetsp:Transcript_5394/g.13049  ORF Transcript_5394/g.13049 Transcript_5394/m.13049 type:complete len:1005 (+) Transcript_5394:65-3079(+)
MDEFEQAVLLVFDPTVTPEVRAKATNICESLQSRPDAWRICWQYFLQKEAVQVRFWCLRVVSLAVPNLPPQVRLEVRSAVLSWWHEQATRSQEDVMIRNKVALICSLLLKCDYPEAWPGAWQDLAVPLSKGPTMIDLFLRVMMVFDEEVVSDEVVRSQEERQRSHVIKHAMRQNDVPALAEWWYNILSNSQNLPPQLVSDCLKIVSAFSVWVEILVLANEPFLDALCRIIADAGPSAGEACRCLASILEKKMLAVKKIQLFNQLQIVGRLDGCVHLASPDSQLVRCEAQLYNTVAEEMLDIYEELRVQPSSAVLASHCWESVRTLASKVLVFFSHEEFLVAEVVEPFLTALFTKVKAYVLGAAGEQQAAPCHKIDLDVVRPLLMQVLQAVIRRMAYPEWFQQDKAVDDEDVQHLAFIEFRRSLSKIFRRIFLLDEEMGYSFLQASTTQLTQQVAAVKPMEAEVILVLLKETGEIVRDLNHHLESKGPLAVCFVQVVECEPLVNVNHWAVQIALIELYVRYGKVFCVHKDVTSRCCFRVLQALMGPQGLRASDSRVVSRASAMFPRFVKLVRVEIMQYMAEIYKAVQELLAVPYIPSHLLPAGTTGSGIVIGSLHLDDQASVYEGLAILVAALPQDQLQASLQLLLKAPAKSITDILAAPAEHLHGDARGYAAWASRSIEVMANISRPFSASCAHHASAAQVWHEALVVVAKVIECFGKATEDISGPVWSSMLFLCRRMVEVLGVRLLSGLDALLLGLCGGSKKTSDLMEILVFAHHIVHQFQKEAESFLRKWLPSLFQESYKVWMQMPQDSEQLKREKVELASSLLQLFKDASSHCPVVLLEAITCPDDSTQHGREIARFLLMCCSDVSELKALYFATATWASLLEAAVAQHPDALHALQAEQVMQQVLWSAVRIDSNDMQSRKVFADVASILQSTSGRLLKNPSQQQLAAERIQRGCAAAMPGFNADNAAQLLCRALAQDATRRDLSSIIQQMALEWSQAGKT